MLVANDKFKSRQWGIQVSQAIKYDWRTHRFDVTMQEAHRVDALDGLQDLAAQAQSGADAEGPAGHAPPQVGQVATLPKRRRKGYQFPRTASPV